MTEQLNRQAISSDRQKTEPTSHFTFENICWLSASGLAIYFSQIIDVLLYDQTIYRSLMHVAFLLILMNVCIAVYLIVWLTMVKKVEADQWGQVHPWLIPIATGCFVAGSFL